MMKRIVAMLLLVAMGLTMMACSLGAPDACEMCNEEGEKLRKLSWKNRITNEKVTKWLCPDCYEDMEEILEWGSKHETYW